MFGPDTGIGGSKGTQLHERIDAELTQKPWNIGRKRNSKLMTSKDLQDGNWPSANLVMDTESGDLFNLTKTPPDELFEGAGESGIARLVHRKMGKARVRPTLGENIAKRMWDNSSAAAC